MLSCILVMNFPRCSEADCNSYSRYRGFAGDAKPGWRQLKVSRLESARLQELPPPPPVPRGYEQVRRRVRGAGDCFRRSSRSDCKRCSERESFKPRRLTPAEWREQINKFLSPSAFSPQGGRTGSSPTRPPTLGPGRAGLAGWAVEEKKRFLFLEKGTKSWFQSFLVKELMFAQNTQTTTQTATSRRNMKYIYIYVYDCFGQP